MRTYEENSTLTGSISLERLKTYFPAGSDDLVDAIDRYEANIKLSAAFYPSLQCLEVSLRNKIHSAMSEQYGRGWLRSGEVPLQRTATDEIQQVWDDLKKDDRENTFDDIIAKLKFSFWIGLLGPSYDESTWRKCNFRAFSNYKGKRQVLQGRLNAIRRFRNRIAHHEPIFQKNLNKTHSEILEAIGWMCPVTQEWASNISPVNELLQNEVAR